MLCLFAISGLSRSELRVLIRNRQSLDDPKVHLADPSCEAALKHWKCDSLHANSDLRISVSGGSSDYVPSRRHMKDRRKREMVAWDTTKPLFLELENAKLRAKIKELEAALTYIALSALAHLEEVCTCRIGVPLHQNTCSIFCLLM